MRLFVAVPLPEELRKRISSIGSEIEQDGIRLVGPGNMHLTLKFIGEADEKKLGDIEKILGDIEFSRFSCSVKKIGVFPNENYIRVVWIGAESDDKLEALADRIMKALHGYGKDERFSSHITIARVRKKIDLKSFLEKHRSDELGSFEVFEFHLIKSELKPEGPEYSVVASFTAED